MISESDFTTGTEVLIERPCGLKGCTSIKIIQNWRDILRISVKSTSGTRSSDAWTKEEKYEITAKQLAEDLNEMQFGPYGDDISILKEWK